jgi:tetratricopeptide (TPR) repeat protein
VKAASFDKEPYVFELLEDRFRFEADGKGQRELAIRVRVQSESAVRELGLLVYSFNSAFESLEMIYARVLKPDGSVVVTPPSDVQELDSAVSRQAPMYTDQREKHIAIKSLSVGDILEFKLRWTIHDAIAPGYFWYDTSSFQDGICLKHVLEFSVPRGVTVNFKAVDPQPVIREEGNSRIYTIQTSHLEKPEKSKIPDWEKNFHGADPPQIRISSFPTWESVGNWYNSLQQPKLAVTPEIRARAEELTRGKSTEEEKIRAIYDFVSTRFRYIGVDLGMGRYSPHSAPDVLANRYGDCKDKHTLFASLLQAAGITAYPAVISSKFRIDPSMPSMSLFDHVITAIPRGENFLFLDTTPEVAPYGLLVSSLRDRQALVIPTNAPAHLVTTPADPLTPNSEMIHIDGSLDSKGTLDAKFSIEEHGDGEMLFRSAYRSTPQNNWQELTQKIANGMGFAGTVSEVSITQPEDTSKPLLLTFSYHRTEFPDWKNHRITLPFPFIYLAELTEEQKLSKEPLPLGTVQDITYDSTVKLPPHFSAIFPDAVKLKPDFASFTATYSKDRPDSIHGVLHLKTLVREIPPNQRAAFDDFSKTVQESRNRYIFIKGDIPPVGLVSPSPLSPGGNSEELISRMQDYAAAHPDNEQVRYALVLAYLNNKQPEKALAFLDKVEVQNPDGTASLNYLYGKTHLAMQDYEKAFARYQKALERDPDPTYLNNVAWDLGDAGIHTTEALDYSKRSVHVLADKTMAILPDEANIADFQLAPRLAASWDTLGWIYFKMSELPLAEKYLEAAWQLSQDALVGEHLVELYEKLGQSHKAASVCSMALAAGPQPETYKKLTTQWEHLKAFLKLPPGRNGVDEASSRGAMALSEMRTIKIPFHAKLQGNSRSAQVVISLINGPKVDDVTFSSGAEELHNAVADMAAAKYPQPFPDDTPVRILRRGTLSCSIYTHECFLILLPIRDAALTN